MWSHMALGLQPSALKIKPTNLPSQKNWCYTWYCTPQWWLCPCSWLLPEENLTVIKSKGAHTCPSIHCIIVCMSCFMLTVVVSLHQQTPPTLWDWEKREWGWTRKWRIGKQWKTILGRGQASSWMHPSQLQQQQQEWGTEWTLSAHQWVSDSPPRCFSHLSWGLTTQCFPKYTKT